MPLRIRNIKYILLLLPLLNGLNACAVCYAGDPNNPTIRGMNNGILLMLGLISFILLLIAIFIYSLYTKQKMYSKDS